MRLSSIAGLLIALVVESGCATSRLSDKRPQTLRQINEQLEECWARIQQTNERPVENIEDVEVGPDTTTFYHRMEEEQMKILTRRVRTVQVKESNRSRRGFVGGAIPHLFVTALGTKGLAARSTETGEALSVMGIVGGLMVEAEIKTVVALRWVWNCSQQ